MHLRLAGHQSHEDADGVGGSPRVDEFIFRFNRRQSNARGLLFYRLLQNAVAVKKLDYETLVWSRRGQAGKVRGRKRKRGAVRRRRVNSQRGATGS